MMKSAIKGSKMKGNVVRFQLKLIDVLQHLYDEETETIYEELAMQQISYLRLMQKQLDSDLGLFKKTMAWIINVKPKHQFLVFKLKNGIQGSIDFYDDNRLIFILGNKDTIFKDNDKIGKRKLAKVVFKGETPFDVVFENSEKKLTLGELIQICGYMVPETGFHKLKNNCSHFSRRVLVECQKELKGEPCIIRNNLKIVFGFELI